MTEQPFDETTSTLIRIRSELDKVESDWMAAYRASRRAALICEAACDNFTRIKNCYDREVQDEHRRYRESLEENQDD